MTFQSVTPRPPPLPESQTQTKPESAPQCKEVLQKTLLALLISNPQRAVCATQRNGHPWLTRWQGKPQGKELLSEEACSPAGQNTGVRGTAQQPPQTTTGHACWGPPHVQSGSVSGQPTSEGTPHQEQWPVRDRDEGQLSREVIIYWLFFLKLLDKVLEKKGSYK